MSQVLQKQSSDFKNENFSFSSRPIVGMFLRPYESVTDAKYFYTSDTDMAKKIFQLKTVRSKFENRPKANDNCSTETVTYQNYSRVEARKIMVLINFDRLIIKMTCYISTLKIRPCAILRKR